MGKSPIHWKNYRNNGRMGIVPGWNNGIME